MVAFFRSLRELAPPDVDLGELGALLDPLPEVVPGSTATSGVSSINKSASMSSTKSDDSNNSDGQQQHKTKKQALASRISNVAREIPFPVSMCLNLP